MSKLTQSETTDEQPTVIDNTVILSPLSPFLYSGEFYDRFEAGAVMDTKHEGDIPFWIDIAATYGDVILELGCGTGRVSVPLAKAGFDVTGLDISESMLSVAKTKSPHVNWVQGDARKFDLNQQFSLILFPYNAMQHLYPDEIKSCLRSVRQSLKPNGRFVIDISNVSPQYMVRLLEHRQELASIF